MDEQLINDRIKLDNITTEMNKISQVAREYMNATPEQRNRVNPDLLASVLDRYNMLKADKLALEQSVVAREMEAQRAAMEQQAQAQQRYNGWGRRRVVVPTPINEEVIVEPVNTQPQMDLYHQNMLNNLIQQGRNNNVANVLSNQNLTAWNTIISSNWAYPGSAWVVGWLVNPTPGASFSNNNNRLSNVPERPRWTTFGSVNRRRNGSTFGNITPNYNWTFLER